LQPCVLTIGQAAGVLAAVCIKEKKQPAQVSVRTVQSALLDAKGYLMPYCDVKPDNPHFKSVQRIGATGILRGVGEPYLWANRTWFYPDSVVNEIEFKNNRIDYYAPVCPKNIAQTDTFYIGELYNYEQVNMIMNKQIDVKLLASDDARYNDMKKEWAIYGLNNFDPKRPITRLELAVWLDRESSEWFLIGKIDMNGDYIERSKLFIPKK
jgi:FAD dependent oxidoreductase